MSLADRAVPRPAVHIHLWTNHAAVARPAHPIRAAARNRALVTSLGPRAADVTVAKDVSGRPRLVGPDAGEFDLSSSSTAGCVAVAVSMGCRIGIDVERVRAGLVDDAIAREALTAEEFEQFKGAAEPVSFFYMCWTMKEAVLKASGHGLSCHPQRVRVIIDLRSDGWQRVETADHRRWMVKAVDGAPGAAMAVATEEVSASPEIFQYTHDRPAALGMVRSNALNGPPTRARC